MMDPKTEEGATAHLAKILAMMCVRNTFLEKIHSGITPTTKTGDYSDVKVIDGEGREILWNELSRINDGEMKTLMKQVVNRLYTWQLKFAELSQNEHMQGWINAALKYDNPELDQGLIRLLEGKWKESKKT